jgi:hypothetical protein
MRSLPRVFSADGGPTQWLKSADKTVRALLHSALTALTASSALFTLTP